MAPTKKLTKANEKLLHLIRYADRGAFHCEPFTEAQIERMTQCLVSKRQQKAFREEISR